MKKSLLYFFSASLGLLALSKNTFAQDAATATWMLNSTTEAAGTGTGDVVVAAQSMSGLNLKGYSDITVPTSGLNNGVAVNAQRLNTTDTDNKWPAGETAMVNTRYTEYQISPATGKDLKVTSVSIDFGDAGSTALMRASVYYSTDNFATQIRLNPVLDPDDGVIMPKLGDGSVRWINVTYPLNVVIGNGKSFKLRTYPWWPGTSSNTKYFVQSNVKINGVTGAPGTLPLNFLSFTAKPDAFGKTVALNWATSNEVNTKNFEIQKRTDAGDFATIGYLNSKNTAGTHNYSFTDNNASAGNSYYRIVQFDNDGAYTSSNVVAVSATGNNSLTVYPNPVDESLNISHALSNPGSSFKILSANGATVLSSAAAANATATSLNVSGLTPGAYVLVFDNKTDSKITKFVKK